MNAPSRIVLTTHAPWQTFYIFFRSFFTLNSKKIIYTFLRLIFLCFHLKRVYRSGYSLTSQKLLYSTRDSEKTMHFIIIFFFYKSKKNYSFLQYILTFRHSTRGCRGDCYQASWGSQVKFFFTILIFAMYFLR